MLWLVLIAIGTYLVWSFLLHRRDRRVRAEVVIPENGHSLMSINPPTAAPDDLCLMVLCYASFVRWLMETEYAVVRDTYRELCKEAVDCWGREGMRLIDRLPTASKIETTLETQNIPKTVPGGEKYAISFWRDEVPHFKPKVWVTLMRSPLRGLSANLPWTVMLLLNAVHNLVPHQYGELALREAWRDWFKAAFALQNGYKGSSGLKSMYTVSYEVWLRARTGLAKTASPSGRAHHSVTESSVIKQPRQAKRDVHTREAEAIKQAIVLVSKYGEVVERLGSLGTQDASRALLYPLSELPASREAIKAAIRLLLTAPSFKDEIANLQWGYSWLAQFVPDADARFAAEVWLQLERQRESGEFEPGFSDKYGRYVELMEAASAERERLRHEIEDPHEWKGQRAEGAKDAKGSGGSPT